MKEKGFKYFKIILSSLVIIDIAVWLLILFPASADKLKLYFLDIGQGDSSLVVLPGGIKVLIDGGPPNGRLEENLEKILRISDRYIDLVMISHPQLDHFGGFIKLFKNYKIGAVLMSEYGSPNVSWRALEKVIKDQNLKTVVMRAGDKIKYGGSELDILNPRDSDIAKNVNDLCLVAILKSSGLKAFYGCDISGEKEKQLANLYDVDVDILKVSHHGSKYSSDLSFLKEARPKLSVIEVGKNRYGHPTKEALQRLASFGGVYRTDRDGLLKLVLAGGKLNLHTFKR
ncbi:MAG: MBL fold metallo-hydrolase [Candidatus Harrisonbacteria bacterium]|nr:MBL fold metallo-hydrolase [Candidatus Harrisonbacteria bacterium]